jgi:sec-independent protein translocase protein TatC
MPLDQIDIDQLEETTTEGAEMSFFDHIAALRGHLVRSSTAVFILTIILFCFKDFTESIINAHLKPDFITYKILCGFSETTCVDVPNVHFQVTGIMDTFTTHMSVSFWLALSIAFPYTIWEIWRFVKPGLHLKEQKAIGGMIFLIGILFFVGVLFGYFVVAPLAIVFLVSYEFAGAEVIPKLDEYVDSLIMFTIPLGLVFELPVLLYFLGKMGIVSSELLVNSRRYAVVILMTIAAFLTPSPDALSMFLLFTPLYLLYEASIFVVRREEKRQARIEALER